MSQSQLRGSSQIQDASIPAAKVDTSIIIASGANPFTGNQSMGSHKLTNVTDPTSAQDAATKNYVDTTIQGLSQKPTARLATTAALPAGTYANGASGVGATFTVTATGTLTVDSVVTALNDLILVKNQASAFQNGLYQVTTAGAGGVAAVLTRHVDMDQSTEFDGAFIPVDNEGTANANTLWLVNNLGVVTVGTTNVTFTQLAAPTTYTGSNGISIAGTVISPTYGSSVNTICQGNDARLSDARTPVGTSLTSASIWVGSAGNVAAAVAITGDVTITNTGVTAIGSAKIVTAILAASLSLVTPNINVATATSINKVTITAPATSATLTIPDGLTLNAGPGGTLTTLAFKTFAPYETPSGTVNGSNTDFTLAHTPVSGTTIVYINGVRIDAGAGNDYTIAGAVITFLTGAIPQGVDKVRVDYWY